MEDGRPLVGVAWCRTSLLSNKWGTHLPFLSSVTTSMRYPARTGRHRARALDAESARLDAPGIDTASAPVVHAGSCMTGGMPGRACRVVHDEAAGPTVVASPTERPWGVVVVGGGIHESEQPLPLFEQVAHLIRPHAPRPPSHSTPASETASRRLGAGCELRRTGRRTDRSATGPRPARHGPSTPDSPRQLGSPLSSGHSEGRGGTRVAPLAITSPNRLPVVTHGLTRPCQSLGYPHSQPA